MLDAAPALPSYASLTPEAAQCVAAASSRYQVPELLLHAVAAKEGGRTGQCSRNKNGSYDCGIAQINTVWFKHFERYGIRPEHIVYDACTNLHLSAYILRTYYNQKADWFNAVVSYNIGPTKWSAERYAIGRRYATDVVRYWWQLHHWVLAAHSASSAQPSARILQYEAPAKAPSSAPDAP